jgi:aspartate racemase
MKKIGIVGGIAWLSTLDYYAGICRRSEWEYSHAGRIGSAPTPEMAIESLDVTKAVSYIGTENDENSWALFDVYHRRALQRVAASGAEFALIASNTPHHRFGSIVKGVDIPVIDLFEVLAQEAAGAGDTRVVMLGTHLTMTSARLRRAFSSKAIEASAPQHPRDRIAIIELIAQLQRGDSHSAALQIERVAKEAFQSRSGSQSVVCLACTELVLAFPEHKFSSRFKVNGVTYLNSSATHIEAAVRHAFAD